MQRRKSDGVTRRGSADGWSDSGRYGGEAEIRVGVGGMNYRVERTGKMKLYFFLKVVQRERDIF